MNTATVVVRLPVDPAEPHHPSATPIYQTATFKGQKLDDLAQFNYSRSANPTRTLLERHLATLEGGGHALACASGITAITLATRLLRPGDEILTHRDLYGGAYRLFAQVCTPRGLPWRWADLRDPAQAAAAITPQTKMIFVESLSNPRLEVVDIQALSRLARERGALLVLDATALPPTIHRGLDLGADIVIHSATKYLGGHSDLTAGVLVTRRADLAAELARLQNAEGVALAPQDTFLLLRGLKTLKVRLDQQQRNAQAVAEHLARHPGVTRVHFPGLPTDPGHALHQRQATGTGSLLSIRLGTPQRARALVESLELFPITYSFGSVTSACSWPAKMSHAPLTSEVRTATEFPEDLVRLAIGLEDPADLIADLDNALSRLDA